MVSEGHDRQDLQRRVVILREATADDGSALEAFDLGDTSSPWLAEVAEIVSGLLAWQRDKEPVDRRVVVAELDDEIVAVAAHLQLNSPTCKVRHTRSTGT